MPSQNLVSATISAEKKTAILQKLAEIKTDLEFLLSLQPDEVRGLFKAANGYAPFIEIAYNVVNEHPEIMPAVFDKEEFFKDYLLSKDLAIIANQTGELTESFEKTLMAVNSDSLSEALEVYAAVKQNQDKVPGLKVIADQMAEFFKKTLKKAQPLVS